MSETKLSRFETVNLVDMYKAYENLLDHWFNQAINDDGIKEQHARFNMEPDRLTRDDLLLVFDLDNELMLAQYSDSVYTVSKYKKVENKNAALKYDSRRHIRKKIEALHLEVEEDRETGDMPDQALDDNLRLLCVQPRVATLEEYYVFMER